MNTETLTLTGAQNEVQKVTEEARATVEAKLYWRGKNIID